MIGKLSELIREALIFVRQNDLQTVSSAVLSREAHPLLQFMKYIVCGGFAFTTHQVVALLLGLFVFGDREYEVALNSTLPDAGTRTVAVAGSGSESQGLMLRVFNAHGTVVAEASEAEPVAKSGDYQTLRGLLQAHWDTPDKMEFKVRKQVVDEATRITGYDPNVERRNHSFINNTIAFLVATVVVYFLNIKFVFTSGRHSRQKEVFLFVAVSGISYVAGIIAVDLVFRYLSDMQALASITRYLSVIANLGFAVTSALVNYVCRKFIIFKH